MKRWLRITLYLLVIVISFLSGWVFESFQNMDLFYIRSEYSLPSTIVVEQGSSDGLYTAQILYESLSKAFFFAIEKKDGSRLIVDNSFVPSAGYHEPIFEMSWDKSNENVFITVDHDFGEGNLEFVFNVPALKLRKVD
jgi:hypothetical protein